MGILLFIAWCGRREPAATVHRNRDARRLERAREGRAGELRALIRVENSRLAVPEQSVLQRRDAEPGVHPRVKPGTFDNRHARTARLAQS